ncbi:hypothetical protein Godav_008869 [Gossypium davidsonii]|uniref:Uncharacterized protein n=1 Tax=Gossypium davidsonii TaxID=34287 RepID=A0A7J8SBD8_GOSDV|nr:hypothetical protein [Gossypium davidsonii]
MRVVVGAAAPGSPLRNVGWVWQSLLRRKERRDRERRQECFESDWHLKASARGGDTEEVNRAVKAGKSFQMMDSMEVIVTIQESTSNTSNSALIRQIHHLLKNVEK